MIRIKYLISLIFLFISSQVFALQWKVKFILPDNEEKIYLLKDSDLKEIAGYVCEFKVISSDEKIQSMMTTCSKKKSEASFSFGSSCMLRQLKAAPEVELINELSNKSEMRRYQSIKEKIGRLTLSVYCE